jgi:hypothetical protein
MAISFNNIVFKYSEVPVFAQTLGDYGAPSGFTLPTYANSGMFDACPTFAYLSNISTTHVYMSLKYIGQATIGGVSTAGRFKIGWNTRDIVELALFDNP